MLKDNSNKILKVALLSLKIATEIFALIATALKDRDKC
jgi:hypothetical protein